MLHKIVEPGKTEDKCYILLKYSCCACHKDNLYHSTCFRYKEITTIGIVSIGIGMLGTICGVEIVMIKKNFSFRTRIAAPV